MEKLIKFFSYDDVEGKIALHPPFMGSEGWSLRSREDYKLLFGVDNFLEDGTVVLEDGSYTLSLVELDDSTSYYMEFCVKGRKVVIEDIVCLNNYKQNIMPDRGIYSL